MASTKFIIKVRPLEVGDLSPKFPFIPEPDEYSMYLDALRDEISMRQIIDTVVRTDSAFEVSTSTSMTEAELRTFLKPLFGGDFFDKLRCVLLAEA